MIENPNNVKESPTSLLEDSRWHNLFSRIVKAGLASLVVIDEAHYLVTDGRDFRVEFVDGTNTFLSLLKQAPRRVPVLAMTATIFSEDQIDLATL